MLQPETSPPLLDGSSKNPVISFLHQFLAQFASAREVQAVPVKARKYPKPAGVSAYGYAEVAQHSTPEDAWLIIEDQVYDVSGWEHPGGDVIFSYAGRDATELFTVMHKNQPVVRAHLKRFLIGKVDKPSKTALLQDWNAMRERFTEQGLMDADALYYIRKIGELLSMVAACAYINYNWSDSLPMVLLSAVILATFHFQCGWTQHDFTHNQVFRSHRHNALVGDAVIGLGMGGSSHWWKTKHNQHHATPNKMDADDKHAIDPDIDTIPLFAWSEALLKQVNLSDRGMIALQHVLLWPLLFVALVNWQAQSVIHLLQYPTVSAKTRRYELFLIGVHHAWVLALCFLPLGLSKGLLCWAVAHALAGFGTSFVFVQSHNAMEIYTDDLDFVTSQMVSTRNINPGVIADWLMGGLNYQIEHHLFPTMPRHSFSRVRREVMEFCAKHRLPYESCSIWESTHKVYTQLATVAKLA